MQINPLDNITPFPFEDHLARAVANARRQMGLSQRELARRAGVSSSVISRIESGAVKTPDYTTVSRIATALSRPATALEYLSGRMAALLEHGDLFDHEPLRGIADELAEREWTTDDWRRLGDAVVDWFDRFTLADSFGTDVGDEAHEAIEQLVSRWSGLTAERKEQVLRFVDDQLTLSELDRRRRDTASGTGGAR